MNPTIFSALIPDADDAARAQIARVLNRFATTLLDRVVDADIPIRPLARGERFADVSGVLRERSIFRIGL